MKKAVFYFGILFLTSLSLNSCGANKSKDKNEQNSENPNASPESVMNTIFQAAKTGEVEILKSLLPPFDEQRREIPCDGDCKALCYPGNETMKKEFGGNYVSLADFQNYFSKAKIIGTPTIMGDEAEVNFVFGPNLEANETMNLQRINGKWYLRSF